MWILFLGIYGILGMACLGALMFGLSQWMAGESPWALVGVPASLALVAFTYGAAFIGQGLRGRGDVPPSLLRRRLHRGRAAAPRRERRPGVSDDLVSAPRRRLTEAPRRGQFDGGHTVPRRAGSLLSTAAGEVPARHAENTSKKRSARPPLGVIVTP